MDRKETCTIGAKKSMTVEKIIIKNKSSILYEDNRKNGLRASQILEKPHTYQVQVGKNVKLSLEREPQCALLIQGTEGNVSLTSAIAALRSFCSHDLRRHGYCSSEQ